MNRTQRILLGLILSACTALAAGCAPTGPPSAAGTSDVTAVPTLRRTASSAETLGSTVATPTAKSTATAAAPVSPLPTPASEAIRLIILHTNDNWGETEPCG